MKPHALRFPLFLVLGAASVLVACDGGEKNAADAKAGAASASPTASKADAKTDAQPDAKPDAKTDAKAAGDEAAPPAKVEKIDMKALKLAGEGWEGEYNEALESWTFEKYTPAGDGTNNPNRFYVDFLPDDVPQDVEGYAKKLQEDQNFQDFGYLFTAIDSKAGDDAGWLIVGTSKDMTDDEDKGEPSFVMYRSAKNVYCRGGTFVDAKLRDEAIEACRSI